MPVYDCITVIGQVPSIDTILFTVRVSVQYTCIGCVGPDSVSGGLGQGMACRDGSMLGSGVFYYVLVSFDEVSYIVQPGRMR